MPKTLAVVCSCPFIFVFGCCANQVKLGKAACIFALLLGMGGLADAYDLAELREVKSEVTEVIEELDDEYREARREGERDWLRVIDKQRKRLRKLLPMITEAMSLHRDLEKAEDDDNFDRAEQIEDKLEPRLAEIERSHHLFELEGSLDELKMLREHVREDGNSTQRRKVDSLVGNQEQLIKLIRDRHQAEDKDDEDAFEELEEQIEKLEEPVALAIEEFHLEWALKWARIEGEDTKELEHELRELRREIKELNGEHRDLDDEPEVKAAPAYQAPKVNPESVDVSGLDFKRDVRSVLQSFCFDCHGADLQKADLNLQSALNARPLVRHRELWLHVIQHLKTGVMPPEKKAQPSDDQRTAVVAWLEHRLETFDYDSIRQPGHEPVRRLSHHEYNKTVRDLFGMDLRPADKFPADATGSSGFDNSANTLFLQPLLMERYFAAAEEVLDAAIPGDRIASPVLAELFAGGVTRNGFAGFLHRAFRRSATSDEVDQVTARYDALIDTDGDRHAALRSALGTALVSSKFLIRSETVSAVGTDHAVGDFDLANRLSYFLWASMPDDRLFELAADRRLQQPDVLRDEVDRMLSHRKADALGEIFAAQWLGYQHLGTRIRLDPIDNPWCTDTLMKAMRDESGMFFVTLLRENQPLHRLIDADFTYLNEELAAHYRIGGVRGDRMRRVALTNDRRGGILGHGSVLAVTSFPGRTSPVTRGKWILSDILGTPPPPPPPNVSEFDERIEENERLSLRRKMELHRRNPSCAACHNQIDPLGLSLEHYDHFGRWRTRTEGGRVDARGHLPNGTEFAGLAGLRKVILEQRLPDLTRQITRKMLAYALGRQLEYFDEAAVRDIVTDVAEDGHRLRTLVHAIVASQPFRYQHIPAE